ncbi:hypothetical protein [Dialister hominis]|uniref:Uncharacterized protein n=1 Tax=Dialister hominis TaxID=2582419 RepID=A0A8D4UU60_9FIRM|nr:hypothetical protein [Dialister hominis]BBK24964.1 hypothetical protein Dia5BBH33_08990 [Dialister hominis]
MTEEQDELIAVENRKKENCIHHLLQMCYASGVKVFDILPAYGADKAIGAAIICYVDGSEKTVRFEGMSAMEMVAAIITKGRLGKGK